MKINFINKAALKLTQFTQDEALEMSINSLMPSSISEVHQNFVDNYMKTGKARMLKTHRELFIKQKGGTVVAVNTYLFLNNLSKKHMILMFEPNSKMKAFEEQYHESPFTFLIADHQFNIGELAANFEVLTGINPKSVKRLKKETDRSLNCDDIIRMSNVDCGISDLKAENITEVEIVFINLHRHQSNKEYYFPTSQDGVGLKEIKIEVKNEDSIIE